MDATNLSPFAAGAATPQQLQAAYATPEQIKSMMDYSQALSKSSLQPVQHWSQGVSNMVSALMGGYLRNRANEQERGAELFDAKAYPDAPNSGKPNTNVSEADEGAPTDKPTKGAPTSALALAPGDGSDLGNYGTAIKKIESSDDYSRLGPITKKGDRAHGAYQVMGKNIGPWTKEVLGKAMTPQEFLASPEAQDKIFNAKFGQSVDKFGNPQDAASVWFTGKPAAKGAGNKDQLGTTGDAYVKRFTKALAGVGGPGNAGPTDNAAPLAFDGTSAPPSNAQDAISKALAGGQGPAQAFQPEGQQVAASKAPPAPMIQPTGGGQYVDPALLPQRPQYSRQQFEMLMASPRIPPEMKALILQQYQGQGQPLDSPFAGGTVRSNPSNPNQQMYIPSVQWNDVDVGGVKVKRPSYLDPSMHQINPEIGGAPAAAPSMPARPMPVTPQRGGEAQPVPGMPVPAPTAENAPVTPPGAAQGAQVASLDPAAGVNVAAAAQNPQSGGVAPQPPLAHLAANDDALRRLVGNDAWDAYKQKQAQDTQISLDKTAQEETNKNYVKRYEDINAAGEKAVDSLKNLGIAKAMMQTPGFTSGNMNDWVTGIKNIYAQIGINPDSATANEVFKKAVSQSLIDGLKTMFGGLGQIRVAEIQLNKDANASPYNTPESNKALITISERAAKKLENVQGMAQNYVSGEAIPNPVNPDQILMPANTDASGQVVPRGHLDVGWDKLLKNWNNANPSFSKDEEANLQYVFKHGVLPGQPDAVPGTLGGVKGIPSTGGGIQVKPASVGGAPASGALAPTIPPQALDMLRSSNGDAKTKAQFDQTFGPGAADRALGGK